MGIVWSAPIHTNSIICYSFNVFKILPPSTPVWCHLHIVVGTTSDLYCPQKQSTALPSMDQNCSKGILLQTSNICAGHPWFLIWEARLQHKNTVEILEQTECDRDVDTLEIFSLQGKNFWVSIMKLVSQMLYPKMDFFSTVTCYLSVAWLQKL